MTGLVVESRDALAVGLCADDSWEHHDQTDDHPCSRCKRQAALLVASGVVTTAEAHRERSLTNAEAAGVVAQVRAVLAVDRGSDSDLVTDLRAALIPEGPAA